MKSNVFLYSATMAFIMLSCKKDQLTTLENGTSLYEIQLVNNTLEPPNLPNDNPLTYEKIALGRMLFYDKDLSKDGTINCASCHIPSEGFSDSRNVSIGVNGTEGGRQSMATFNLAWHENGFFWDGRAELLRHQVVLPIKDALEMNESIMNVISKLGTQNLYTEQFTTVYGDNEITEDRIALALEAFLFSIVSDDSKYDRFRAHKTQLTTSEERGRALFFRRFDANNPQRSGANCASCHRGGNFDDNQYLNNGLDSDAEFTDLGRENVTGRTNDRAKFKVPTLRNIALTAPYMHDGRFSTLEEVIDHYDHGIKNSSTVSNRVTTPQNSGLNLTEQDKADLVKFLHTLTDHNLVKNPAYQNPF